MSDGENNKFIPGFTNNLVKSVHELKCMQSSTDLRAKVNKLVYYEKHDIYEDARRREREVSRWEDSYIKTIVGLQNGRFEDLYEKIF